MPLTNPKLIPNATDGGSCPDWPEPCICSIDPPHIPMPALRAQCGHCTTENVIVPQDSKMASEPTVNDLVMAGAEYCPRCQRPLCLDCGDKEPDLINYECASII